MSEYWPMIKESLEMFMFLGGELSILFILISAGVSLAQQYIPDSRIQALLGGSHGRGYFLAAALGAITPFCSCSTIPMLRGLLRAKAGFGPILTFLFSSPLLNPIIIGLFIATFGWKVTIWYSVIALLVSIFSGYILSTMNFVKYVIPERGQTSQVNACCASSTSGSCCQPRELIPLQPLRPLKTSGQTSCCETSSTFSSQHSSCCETSTSDSETSSNSCCAASPIPPFFSGKLKRAFRDGWNQFLQVLPYLLIGVTLGALIYGFVPDEFIVKYASEDNLFAVPVAAVIGIPLYVRVEALIPLAAVLVGKGMSLGAVMALIIGGGGSSLTELILLKSMFKMPLILAFLTVILGMAIMAGYMFQFIL